MDSFPTWVSRYQKGKNQSGFKWGKRGWGFEVQWHQQDHMQTICIWLQTHNHTNTSSLNFLYAGCSSWCPSNSVRALKPICHTLVTTHAHTHPFNDPFSGTTRVSRYQKGKTNLDFTEARDSEWQWHQLGHIQICISLQTDNRASTLHCSSFLQAGCCSCRPTNSIKALKAHTNNKLVGNLWPSFQRFDILFYWCNFMQ